MNEHLLFFMSFFLTCSCLDGEFINLKNRAGTEIEARILNYQNGQVKLERKDGVIFVVSISMFDAKSVIAINHKIAEIIEYLCSFPTLDKN